MCQAGDTRQCSTSIAILFGHFSAIQAARYCNSQQAKLGRYRISLGTYHLVTLKFPIYLQASVNSAVHPNHHAVSDRQPSHRNSTKVGTV